MMDRFSSFIDALNDKIGKAVSWLTLSLVLLVCFDVSRRFLINRTDAWIMELQWHLFAMIFLLGAAYTLKETRHVRVDLFYNKFDEKNKALLNIIGAGTLLIPLCALLTIVSSMYAYDSYLIHEKSPDPGGLSHRFLIKAIVPLSMVLLLLQAVSELLKNIKSYRQWK